MPENSSSFLNVVIKHFQEKYTQITGAAFVLTVWRLTHQSSFDEFVIIKDNQTATYLLLVMLVLGLAFVILFADAFLRIVVIPSFQRIFGQILFYLDIKKCTLEELKYIEQSLLGSGTTARLKAKKENEVKNLIRMNRIINKQVQDGYFIFDLDISHWYLRDNPSLLDILESRIKKLEENKK